MPASGPFLPPPPNGSTREDQALQQALFLLDKNRPQEAERIAGEVLKAQPHHPRGLYILGCALIMQDRAQAAIAPLEAAARGRRDPEFETMLAIALRQAGRQQDASSQLRLAVKRRPPYAPAFKELGYLLVLMECYDEAVEVLNRGVEIAPMMPQLSIQLGYAHLSRRDSANAKIAFARALEISPRSRDALFGMAKAYLEIGDCEPAAVYFRRSLSIDATDQAAWLHLGHCLLELRQLEAGYDCFRTAARGDPRNYGSSLSSFAAAVRGRFWLKPSAAKRFLLGDKATASAPGTDGDKRQSHA